MKKKQTNGIIYDEAYEKLFMPELYSDQKNYTVDKAFAISNEALDQVFDGENLTNKKVLTVGSSGDQALNSIINGSTDVTVIDVNVFAKLFIEYKIALIKTFNYEEFDSLFIKSQAFEWQTYSKISHLLSKETQQFWDSLMLDLDTDLMWGKLTSKTIKERMLIVDHRDRFSRFYHNKKEYTKLQSLLNSGDVKINFVNAELLKFSSVLKNQKFDLIYLSNIYDYYSGEIDSQLFKSAIDNLYSNNLNPNGRIVANYEFNSTSSSTPEKLGKYKIQSKFVSRQSYGEIDSDTVWIINKNHYNNPSEDLEK